MKKLLLGIAGLMLMIVMVLLFTFASDSKPINKDAATELSKNNQSPDAIDYCCPKGENQTCCDPEKCEEMKCNPDDCNIKNCDPATCPHHTNKEITVAKNCEPTTCKSHCPSK